MEKLLEFLSAKRGRQKALAAELKCSPSAISMWKQVPAERVAQVSHFTGISREDLRPDLFEVTS